MFTRDLEMCLMAAQSEAKDRRHEYLCVEHILYALLHNDNGVRIIRSCGGNVDRIKEDLEEFFDQQETMREEGSNPQQTRAVQRVLHLAIMHVNSSGKASADVGDILVAIHRESQSYASYFLQKEGITRLDLLNYISHGIAKVAVEDEEENHNFDSTDEEESSQGRGEQDALKHYTTNLTKLAEEDPTFQVKTDEASGQTIISGMGELHLDIIVDRLRREFKVEVNQGQPQVEYKEAVTASANHREVYKKQTGGRGKFADIVFTIEPAEEGKTGLEFINNIKGGNIPKEYIPSVEKGFKEAMKNGPLAGFEIDSLKVALNDGSFHPVDSDSLSFELAAKLGFKEAAKLAKSVIMEPMMKLEVLTPEANMGDIVGDLNRRRGQVNNMDDRAGAKVVKAIVPLSEMFGYVTALRTLSSGRATSTMEFSHYAQTPSNISDDVISSIKGNNQE